MEYPTRKAAARGEQPRMSTTVMHLIQPFTPRVSGLRSPFALYPASRGLARAQTHAPAPALTALLATPGRDRRP